MNIDPVVPESLHWVGGQREGRTDRCDEANSRFWQCWRNACRGSWFIVTKRNLPENVHGVHYVKVRYITSRNTFLLVMNAESHILIMRYDVYSAVL